MFGKLKKDEVPILYQITNLSKYGLDYFILDSDEYSLFPYEQEVLFRTGSWFDIVEISEEFDENSGVIYFLITLNFIDILKEIHD